MPRQPLPPVTRVLGTTIYVLLPSRVVTPASFILLTSVCNETHIHITYKTNMGVCVRACARACACVCVCVHNRCAYNMVNGKPCCANAELLHTLRKDWNFDGYITSDSDSCGDIYASHHYAKDPQHAAQLCLAGGTNIDSGNTYSKNIAPGVAAGVVNLSDARAALRGAYKLRMTLGLFDPNITDANRKITPDVIGNDEHRLTSLMTARQSMTLLKNDLAKGLPFTPGKKLAVIGPDSDSIQSIMQPSNYNSNNICPPQHGAGAGAGGTGGAGGGGESAGVNFSCLDTLWAGLNKTNAAAGGSSTLITAGAGSTWNATGIAAAVALAQAADNVIVFVSNAEIEGGEGHDRASIALPPDQIALAAAVFKAIAGKPGVRSAMLMINGGVMAYDDFKETPPSILEIFMPGVYGAQAVAETVWGTNVPSGKLPFTMYYSNYTDGLSIDDMSMTAGPGRTYVRHFYHPHLPSTWCVGLGLFGGFFCCLGEF